MYKIGDKVLYKDSTTVRSIRDINDKGELLLWGMYEYTDPKNVTNLKGYQFIVFKK